MTRPAMELAGFARAWLQPGETKRITFTCAPSQAAFLTREMKWKIEKGDLEILIGTSSDHIVCKDSIFITEDQIIPGAERRFYADVCIAAT